MCLCAHSELPTISPPYKSFLQNFPSAPSPWYTPQKKHAAGRPVQKDVRRCVCTPLRAPGCLCGVFRFIYLFIYFFVQQIMVVVVGMFRGQRSQTVCSHEVVSEAWL